MMKDVIINIKGSQKDDSNSDSIEITTLGRFGERDGGYYLSYDESDMLGVKGVKTSLYVKSDGSVILQRTGGLESRLVIVKDKRNTCYYSIPQGELSIGIFGEKVENNLTSNGGSLSVQYTIDSNLNFISRNTVNISVSEVNKNVDNCCKN